MGTKDELGGDGEGKNNAILFENIVMVLIAKTLQFHEACPWICLQAYPSPLIGRNCLVSVQCHSIIT